MTPTLRVGHGQDAHRLSPGQPLMLGGLQLPSERGADAHSDGDVLLHALADALLSAYALGDIGQLFPPSDPRFRGLAGRRLVEEVLGELQRFAPGARLVNVAAVITLDAPKLGPHRGAMAESVATILGLDPEAVGLTFKTSEGLAPDFVQASAVVLLEQGGPHP